MLSGELRVEVSESFDEETLKRLLSVVRTRVVFSALAWRDGRAMWRLSRWACTRSFEGLCGSRARALRS